MERSQALIFTLLNMPTYSEIDVYVPIQCTVALGTSLNMLSLEGSKFYCSYLFTIIILRKERFNTQLTGVCINEVYRIL